MNSDGTAYGRRQQHLLRTDLQKFQFRRLMEMQRVNQRLKELEREKGHRRKLLEKQWVRMPSHRELCRGRKGTQQSEENRGILRSIDARAAYFESQLLDKLHFLRHSESPSPNLSTHSSYYQDSYSLRSRALAKNQHTASMQVIRDRVR